MMYDEMSDAYKAKMRYAFCAICNKKIELYEDVQYCEYRIGRRKFCDFLHTSCLQKGRQRMADVELTREGV